MQPFDITTLIAVTHELRQNWLPARIEQVYQRDRHTIYLALRTITSRGWLAIAWHPEAARICLDNPPPKVKDTFTFSDQLRHQLNGLALIDIKQISPWERVLDWQFAERPGEEALFHLYVEIMGKYSNVILTDVKGQIVSAAYQVNEQQSSVRQIKTGQPYQLPPSQTGRFPQLTENQISWQERVNLVPGKITSQLLQSYRGLSPAIAKSLVKMAAIDPQAINQALSQAEWDKLFYFWQKWLKILENKQFVPGWTEDGYTVLGWGITKAAKDVQTLVATYYQDQLNRRIFQQLQHQIGQKIKNIRKKQEQKAENFRKRLQESAEADIYRQEADLLMANLHLWQPGMSSIVLEDFTTHEPREIKLNPEKNAVLNAQSLYKNHQKLKRAREAVQPLLAEVEAEIEYLEQIQTTLQQLSDYQESSDLATLEEIREELISQQYWKPKLKNGKSANNEAKPRIYLSPSAFEVWVGRNNRQNDQLTFRLANDYDLWFHAQEIPGSHVLLRLKPGSVPEKEDLQYAANLASYYSRARQSEQVPVVYTQPKYVYKPKGAKPGMCVYKKENIIWAYPASAKNYTPAAKYSS